MKGILALLAALPLTADAEEILIEATGPNVVGRKEFLCVEIRSQELYYDPVKKGMRAVKDSSRTEACDVGIYPGRNYHVYIVMHVFDDQNNITGTYDLPPYFVYVAAERKPMPPVIIVAGL